MPVLIHTNENEESTYFLTRVNKAGEKVKRLAWCHENYPEDMRNERTGAEYASLHEVTDAEADRLAIVIRGGNLTVETAEMKKERLAAEKAAKADK